MILTHYRSAIYHFFYVKTMTNDLIFYKKLDPLTYEQIIWNNHIAQNAYFFSQDI